MGAVAVAVAQLRVGEPVAVDEGPPVVAEVAGVDSKHREPLRAVPAIEGLEQRRLVAARQAPRGPEVDQHPASAVVGDARGPVAVEAGQVAARRLLADRDVGPALAEQAEAQQADHGKHGEEDCEGASAHPAKGREGRDRGAQATTTSPRASSIARSVSSLSFLPEAAAFS